MDDLLNIDATEAVRRIREKDTTAEALTAMVLEHAQRTEPKVGAFLRLDVEGALAQAKAVDAGKASGPLAGVPIAIKDNIHVKGQLTTLNAFQQAHTIAKFAFAQWRQGTLPDNLRRE